MLWRRRIHILWNKVVVVVWLWFRLRCITLCGRFNNVLYSDVVARSSFNVVLMLYHNLWTTSCDNGNTTSHTSDMTTLSQRSMTTSYNNASMPSSRKPWATSCNNGSTTSLTSGITTLSQRAQWQRHITANTQRNYDEMFMLWFGWLLCHAV